jgi:VIT1/CCC1 family predicted Fe2+/Mn2+ transporter
MMDELGQQLASQSQPIVMSANQRTTALREVATVAARSEYVDSQIFRHLANTHKSRKREHARELAVVFDELSETEYQHYQFWRKFSPSAVESKVGRLRLGEVVLIEAVLGAAFAIKFLQRHEKSTLEKYRSVENLIPEEDTRTFRKILKDEAEHEKMLAEQVPSTVLRYMSFIVLGLADAIVEISGIHAGSLGVYNSTELTGLAGIVAGAAASISMASAAFAQAKQGFQGSAKISAMATGLSYFANAVLLAAPYFLISKPALAMGASLTAALGVLVFTSYYNSIISGADFRRDLAELAGTMFGASVALLLLGEAIRMYFGIAI